LSSTRLGCCAEAIQTAATAHAAGKIERGPVSLLIPVILE
jgi:hypothetical protein